jgi:hypothetical protein
LRTKKLAGNAHYIGPSFAYATQISAQAYHERAKERSNKMLSRFSMRWRWYDWIFVSVIVIVIVGAIRVVAPTSGLSHSLHQGFHALAVGLEWIASGLSALVQLLNEL